MITTEAVSIRNDYATGLYTKSYLADKYGCNRDTIASILKRSEDKDVYIRTNLKDNPLIYSHLEYIEELFKKGNPTAKAIYHSICSQGANISYSTIAKAVRKIKLRLDLAAIRYETTPGQQAQADWANFIGFRVNINGKQRRIYGFFMVLGYSRMKYVEIVTKMDTKTLNNCIENALRYFGGTPKEVLFDNMPQIVNRCLSKTSIATLERELLPEFTSFADHMGFDIVLCRIRRPQEKGKVERFVKEFKTDFLPMLQKKTDNDIDYLNKLAIDWCNRHNSIAHRTTNEIPFERLKEEGLKELPEQKYYDVKTAKVGKDGSVYFQGKVYQVDSSYAGSTVNIIDMERYVFAEIDGNYSILTSRKLPVYIRKRYSGTNQEIHQQKRPKKNNDLASLLSNNLEKLDIDWSIYDVER